MVQNDLKTIRHQTPPLWRDIRVLQMVGQFIFTLVVLIVAWELVNNMLDALEVLGQKPDFRVWQDDSFFQEPARFSFNEGPGIGPNDTFGQAFIVGIVNALRAVVIGIILSTLMGIFIGVGRLSNNFLVRTISSAYVEFFQNTPLLVQLIFIYRGMTLLLPQIEDVVSFPDSSFNNALMSIVLFLFTLWVLQSLWNTYRDRIKIDQRLLLSIGRALIFGFLAWYLAWIILALVGGVLPDSLLGIIGSTILVPNLIVTAIIPDHTALTSIQEINMSIIWALLFVFFVIQFGIIWVFIRIWSEMKIALALVVVALIFIKAFLPTNMFFLSNRGFVIPAFHPTGTFSVWLAFIGLAIMVAVFVRYSRSERERRTGRPSNPVIYSIGAFFVVMVIGWFVVSNTPISVDIPDGGTIQEAITKRTAPFIVDMPELRTAVRGGRERIIGINGGETISPEYAALLIGLILYTAAFIGEIVRAGIQAVSHGQLEAAYALGLSKTETLQRIVLPQALRVIIPPLGNQYLNLTKNSSLATAIGFMDVFAVTKTIIHQSGQDVVMVISVMLAYLVASLSIAAVMNWLNGRMRLKER